MQGFNMGRYVPPEHEGVTSANKLAGKHALGARARKLHSEGILVVRFEMPFAVWCEHCPKPTIIGQGVRFNAEKKKVGNYYSTPIFSFRMKHAACGGVIEITTDPKNAAYHVTEGGKQRDLGLDKVREGEEGLEILSAEEREKRREDAFAALEGKKQDEAQAKEYGKRTRELFEASELHWDDPYEANKRLRNEFRVGRKAREKAQEIDEKLKDKMGLDVELLPEHEDDKARAAFIEFGRLEGVDEGARKATSKPLFSIDHAGSSDTLPLKKGGKKLSSAAKKQGEAERRLVALQQEIRDNSRAAKDPFLSFGSLPTTATRAFRPLPNIRRRTLALEDEAPVKVEATSESSGIPTDTTPPPPRAALLVDYDSDQSD